MIVFSTKVARTGYLYGRKTPYTENHSKWIKDTYIKAETKSSQEWARVLKYKKKSINHKKSHKLNFVKTKASSLQKIVRKMRKKATDWEKMFTIDMSKLVFWIYTEFLQLNTKTLFKLEKYLDISQKIYKWLKSTWKMLNIPSLATREMKNKT